MIMIKSISSYYIDCFQGFSTRTWLIITAVFFSAMGYMAILFLPLYLNIALHFSIKQIAVVLASYGLGQLIGSYISGYYLDRVESKFIALSNLSLRVMAGCFLIATTSYLGLVILLLVFGIADGGFRPATNMLLLKNTPKTQHLRINGLYRLAINLGAGCSALSGILTTLVGYSVIFYGSILLNAIAIMILVNVQKSTEATLSSTKQSDIIAPNASPIWRDVTFLAMAIILLFNGFAYAQTSSTLPIYLHTYFNISGYGFGNLFLINTLLIIALEVPLLTYLNRYNQVYVAMLGTILICTGLGLLALGHNLPLAIASFIIWTLGEILSFATILTLVYNLAKDKNKGQYLGGYHVILGLVSIVSPILGSWLYPFYDGKLLWLSCIVLGVLSCGIFLMVKKSLGANSGESC